MTDTVLLPYSQVCTWGVTLGDTATPFPHLFPALALALLLVARAAVLLVHSAGDVLLPPPEG